MTILESAKGPELERLLDLYPVSTLKERWPADKKNIKKVEITEQVGNAQTITAIAEFADEYLSCCKQHVYVYKHKGDLAKLPTIQLLQADRVHREASASEVRLLYIVHLEYSVILRDPLEQVTLTFLWPVRLDFNKTHLLVRFVTLEKNIGSYVGERRYNIAEKGILEDTILKELESSTKDTLKLGVVDLHKGIKKLWDAKPQFIDATRARYRKSHSAAAEDMDVKYHIRKNQPALYKTLQASFLLHILFDVLEEKETSVSAFWANPGNGLIGFPRYSESRGDTDDVVREILRYN
jgi:hypothetical protein